MLTPSKITNSSFYSRPHFLLRLLQIYVMGDALVLLPLWLIIVVSGFFSWQFMLIEIGVFLALRGTGEMVYWLLQQFGKQEYRPATIFKNLGNNSVYIVYQLSAMVTAFFGIMLVIMVLKYAF